VVVDVCLSVVLLLGVLVALVGVRDGRMVVLVVVSRDEVSDLLLRPVVVGHMDVPVGVDQGIVIVGLGHLFLLRRRAICSDCGRVYSCEPMDENPWSEDYARALGTIGQVAEEVDA
jgi:hypothetical protein